jgi:hypothetical protein
VAVPAGTCSWESALSLPSAKDLNIIGAGIGNTVLTCSSGLCFQIHLAAAHRISGFTMSGPGGMVTTTNNNNQDPAKYFRIDHNRLVSTSGWQGIVIAGSSNGVHPQGLIDNNEIVDISIKTNGTNFGLDEADYQHVLWAQTPPIGAADRIVYVESNTFSGSSANINFADGNYSGRYVFRFNQLQGRGYIEIHSIQGLNRAMQWYEIYGNTFNTSPSWPGIAFIRGGTGIVFGNRLPGTYDTDIVFDNVRSERDPGETVGRCDGSSAWDGNTPGESGYPCRDQIGRSQDAVLWDDSPPGVYAQVLRPLYLWDNLKGGDNFVIDNSGLDTWLKQNRDWYTTAAAFDGTAGVGEGPLASRPSTCTTGVAYWATDEGSWNTTRPASTSGLLYQCMSTNTWTLYYTPLTYPHPLAGATPLPPPPPSVALSVVRAGTGSGTVTSTPAGIDCGGACSASFPSGTSVTLTATPAAGSSFDGWSACGGTGTCTLELTAVTSVQAIFSAVPPPPVTVNLTANPASVEPQGFSTLTWSTTNATSCTASSVGAEGSTWIGPKPTSGSDVRGPLEATATYTLTCTGPGGSVGEASVTVTVVDQPPAPTTSLTAFTLTARVSGRGTVAIDGCSVKCVSCAVSYVSGSVVTLVAQPAAGARFLGWTGGDCAAAGTGPCAATMTNDLTITAKFTKR